jgi:hypothetical protein
MRVAVCLVGASLTACFFMQPGCSLYPWDQHQFSPDNPCEQLSRCCPEARQSACDAAREEGLKECAKLLDTIRSQSDCRD